MTCKGICIRHKDSRPKTGEGRYATGQKRCQMCEIFIRWEANNFCPCCGYRLRTKPRNSKGEKKVVSEEPVNVLLHDGTLVKYGGDIN